jgi:ABC-type phosphate transport system substrate-binding protein
MAPQALQRPFSALRHARRSHLAWALALGLFLGLGGSSRVADASDAELKIIIHPSNAARTAEKGFLADAFLKKVTRWPGGETIHPLDQRPDTAVRRSFSQNILKRTVAAVRSYWQQRIFSGRDVPPPELDSDASVIDYVERTPGAVGYVSRGAKLGSARELQVQ